MKFDIDRATESFLDKGCSVEIDKVNLLELTKLYFKHMKEEMESGNLDQIRIKYFGTFRPLLGKLKHLQKNINWEKLTDKEKERYEKLFKNYERISHEIEKES